MTTATTTRYIEVRPVYGQNNLGFYAVTGYSVSENYNRGAGNFTRTLATFGPQEHREALTTGREFAATRQCDLVHPGL